MIKAPFLSALLLAFAAPVFSQSEDSSDTAMPDAVYSGLRIWLGGDGGAIFSGAQTETGIIWFDDKGDTVSSRVSQSGFHGRIGYCLAGRWVFDAGYATRFVSVQPEKGTTKDPLSLFTKHYLILHPQFVLGSFGNPVAPILFLIGLENRYVWFKLDSEYKQVFTETGGDPVQTTAVGVGWAGTFGVEWMLYKYGMARVGFALGRENAAFPNSQDLDANDFAFDFSIGLHL